MQDYVRLIVSDTHLGSDYSKEDLHKFLLSFNFNCDTNTDSLLENCRKNDGWVDVNAFGGGFMMFSRELVIDLIKANPEIEYQRYPNQLQLPEKLFDVFKSFVEKKTKMYLSEDYGFCHLVKEMGGNIIVNLFHEIGHTGSCTFKGEPATQAVYSFLTGKKY